VAPAGQVHRWWRHERRTPKSRRRRRCCGSAPRPREGYPGRGRPAHKHDVAGPPGHRRRLNFMAESWPAPLTGPPSCHHRRSASGSHSGSHRWQIPGDTGDTPRQFVQLNALQSDARRHTATLRGCLLSSGSRVRILPGAHSSEPIWNRRRRMHVGCATLEGQRQCVRREPVTRSGTWQVFSRSGSGSPAIRQRHHPWW